MIYAYWSEKYVHPTKSDLGLVQLVQFLNSKKEKYTILNFANGYYSNVASSQIQAAQRCAIKRAKKLALANA